MIQRCEVCGSLPIDPCDPDVHDAVKLRARVEELETAIRISLIERLTAFTAWERLRNALEPTASVGPLPELPGFGACPEEDDPVEVFDKAFAGTTWPGDEGTLHKETGRLVGSVPYRTSEAKPEMLKRRVWRSKYNKSLLDQTPEELADGDEVETFDPVADDLDWARAFLWRVTGQRPATNHVGELVRAFEVRRSQRAVSAALNEGGDT